MKHINKPRVIRIKFRVVWNSAISCYQIQHQDNDFFSWIFGWDTVACEFKTLEEAEKEMDKRSCYWNY